MTRTQKCYWNLVWPITIGLAVALVGSVAPAVHAEIIVDHVGTNNPTTESPAWSLYTALGDPVVGAGNDELAHWSIECPLVPSAGTGRGVSAYYKFSLADYFADPGTDGWTTTAVAKVITATAGNATFSLVDETDWWGLQLVGGPGVTGTGVYTFLGSWTSTLLSSVDPTIAYHAYQIVLDPVGAGPTDDRVTYYMDGNVLGTYSRADTPDHNTKDVLFGDGSTTDGASESHWASCRFETGQHVIPEPSTLVLLAMGGLGLLAWRLRRRRHSAN